MSGYQTPEQLDKEVDELMIAAGLTPPATDTETVVEPAPAEPVVTPPAVVPAPVVVKPSPPADTDDLDGLTLEQAEERIRNAQARMTRATMESADLRRSNSELESRFTTLQSQITTLQTQLDAAKAKPPATDSAPVTKKYASLEALRDDYAQFIDPILEATRSLETDIDTLRTQVASLGGRITETNTAVTTKAEADAKRTMEAAKQKHFDTILAANPDAYKINASQEFHGWLERQPPMYANAIKQGSANDVIFVLNQYEKAIGATRLQEARDVAEPTTPKNRTQPTKSKPTFTREQIAAMSPSQFEANEPAIDEALSEGRVT